MSPREERNLQRIADTIAAKTALLPKTVRFILEQLTEMAREQTWEKGRFTIPGLATFKVRPVRARKVASPPGAKVQRIHIILDRKVVKVRATDDWRAR